MKNLIITGSGGFVGFSLAKHFLSNKFNVIGIDNLSRKGSINRIKILKKNFNNFLFYKCDVTNHNMLNHIFSNVKKVHAIMHTAGQVTVTESLVDPIKDFKINGLGTLNLLDLTKKYHSKSKFIFSSTNKVYGNLNNMKVKKIKSKYYLKQNMRGISENLNVDYCSPYGCSKGSADQYVKDFGRIFKMNTIVLRKSCIYGQDQLGIKGQGWISYIINQAIMKKKITIFGNGYQTRDILYIDDLVELYNKIVNKNIKGYKVYNVGGGKKNLLSVHDLIDFLRKQKILKNKPRYSKERLGDQKTYYSDLSKVKKELNWSPKISKISGLNKILKYSINNLNTLKKIYR